MSSASTPAHKAAEGQHHPRRPQADGRSVVPFLALLGTGASNKEIADRLCLAEGTVKNHVTSILTKLDVRDHAQAALRARSGLQWRAPRVGLVQRRVLRTSFCSK